MSAIVSPYTINSYTVIVHEAEEGGYWGEVLEKLGCVSQGETIDEFRNNIREALEAVLESELEAHHIGVDLQSTMTEKEFVQFKPQETWTAVA